MRSGSIQQVSRTTHSSQAASVSMASNWSMRGQCSSLCDTASRYLPNKNYPQNYAPVYVARFFSLLHSNHLFKLMTKGNMPRVSIVKASLATALCMPSCLAFAQLPQPDGGTIERGVLPARWLSQKPKCMEIPEWQVHEYNPNFYILRQSPCTDFEKPFIYLIFGKDKALLMDTGSRNGNLAPTLQRTVKNWLARNAR